MSDLDKAKDAVEAEVKDAVEAGKEAIEGFKEDAAPVVAKAKSLLDKVEDEVKELFVEVKEEWKELEAKVEGWIHPGEPIVAPVPQAGTKPVEDGPAVPPTDK